MTKEQLEKAQKLEVQKKEMTDALGRLSFLEKNKNTGLALSHYDYSYKIPLPDKLAHVMLIALRAEYEKALQDLEKEFADL